MPWEAVRLQTAYLQCSLAQVHFGPPTPLGSRLKSLHDRRRRRCWDARKLHQQYFKNAKAQRIRVDRYREFLQFLLKEREF